MKLMVIGGGGREHAIVTYLKKSPKIDSIYVLPGNAGIAEIAETIDIAATDIDGMIEFAKRTDIDFVFVSPDDPLVLGAVDALTEAGFKCFGPNKAAAEIEGSKVFSKNLMKKYGIPTASYNIFDSYDAAVAYIKQADSYPTVIKVEGLALGKGVTIAESFSAAETALKAAMKDKVFGDSGNRVVIEEFLTGPEVSMLCFTDGKVIKPMVSSMDYKAIYEGNTGPNTGGMGAVSPNRYYTDEIANYCMQQIFIPTMNAMNLEGRTFKGCIYFGLMLTDKGPYVIEYNCRFGDPETQVVLPLLETDLFSIVEAVADSRLDEIDVVFSDAYACCVVAASGGYPVKYEIGKPISFGDFNPESNIHIFHSGTKLTREGLITAGGRVVGVTAIAATANQARVDAYEAVKNISFEDIYFRMDIGS
ncbi:MAG: phosphoribosylamine--glycine ligase [Oscillospiraceae bacterium]|nr:phosphoribosylamine--glycine ligase [Oscillospiraceae bacterium]